MSFVHLHCHTHYSFLQGLPKPQEYVARAKELGQGAVAITDAGGVYGLLDFYEAARKAGVHPVLGVQVFVAPFGRHQKRSGVDHKTWNMVLLAETDEGYRNLLSMVTASFVEGFYYRPRVDYELFERYGKGIIALSGNFNGEIAAKALSGDTAGAKEALAAYQGFFGRDNVYLEVLPHGGLEQQVAANAALTKLAAETGVPLVAANACHYVRREDAEAQDVVVAIQKGVTVDTANRFSMLGTDFSMLTEEEMLAAFAGQEDAVHRTGEIAARCKVEIPLGKRLIPTFPTPFQKTADEYLWELAWEGLEKRYGIREGVAEDSSRLPPGYTAEQVVERLEYEMSVITSMGFSDYFLIVWDFVKYAKENGVMVGPGRGSAAGALLSYCLGITNLEPLRYKLLFERFLNPERVSMPDIDIDFADDKREVVLQYVADKYGRDHVARICTFGTMASRAAVKDVGRAFGVPFADMNAFSALIPARPGISLAQAEEESNELKKASMSAPYDKVFAIAKKIEGNARQVGVHACAVVIADKPLTEYTALQKAPGDDTEMITQYSMHPLEDIGLLKMDFLGLRNLTIIRDCLSMIERRHGVVVDIDTVPMDDAEVFRLFARGQTTGVFQFESPGMKRYLKELQPTCFEDLIAMAALYRPGPMDDIPRYIKNKHNPSGVTYPHPILEQHLKETYGVVVYQEQVQQLAQEFAGFSLGQGYLMVKAVAKKIGALLEEQRVLFIESALKQGHTKKEAETLFAIIEPFAHYGFNKAHSACYAYIAYQTGYLKTHYAAEFVASLMTADSANLDRLTIDIEEAREMGIAVRPPDVNHSHLSFSVDGTGAIRFGLLAIKGMGEGPARAILDARERGGEFADMADFASRVGSGVMNKRTLEALAFSGALDALGDRASIVASTEAIAEFAKAHEKSASTSQGSLFGDTVLLPEAKIKLKKVPALGMAEKLAHEKALLGMYLSSHPLAGLKKMLGKKAHLMEKLDGKLVGKQVTVAGIVAALRMTQTKKTKESLCFITLEDPTGSMEVMLFGKALELARGKVAEGKLLLVQGRLDKRGGKYAMSGYEVTEVHLDALRAQAERDGMLDDSTGYAPVQREEEDVAAAQEVAGGTEVVSAVAERAEGAGSTEVALPVLDDEVPAKEERKPYEVCIPVGTSEEVLKRLKLLLVENKDATGSEVTIVLERAGEAAHRIALPFRVGITEDTEREMLDMLRVRDI